MPMVQQNLKQFTGDIGSGGLKLSAIHPRRGLDVFNVLCSI